MGELAPGSRSFALCLLALTAAGMAAAAGPRAGWKELSLLNANEARDLFAAATEADPASREARLGAAISLLSVQPRTDGNIATATQLLEALRAESPNDEEGIGATYYLARIQQLHSSAPDRPAAVAAYRELLAAHPGNHYAEMAAPKLAVLLLYDDVPRDEWERRVAEIETLIPRLTATEAVRDTRLVLAGALIRLRRDHARAYPLVTACLEANLVTRLPHLNALLLQAAESARQLGNTPAAITYYRRFLGEFPRDIRADEVHRRLETLEQKPRP